jgi:hypothetical protein
MLDKIPSILVKAQSENLGNAKALRVKRSEMGPY